MTPILTFTTPSPSQVFHSIARNADSYITMTGTTSVILLACAILGTIYSERINKGSEFVERATNATGMIAIAGFSLWSAAKITQQAAINFGFLGALFASISLGGWIFPDIFFETSHGHVDHFFTYTLLLAGMVSGLNNC